MTHTLLRKENGYEFGVVGENISDYLRKIISENFRFFR